MTDVPTSEAYEFDENYVNDWAGMSTPAGRAWHAWNRARFHAPVPIEEAEG